MPQPQQKLAPAEPVEVADESIVQPPEQEPVAVSRAAASRVRSGTEVRFSLEGLGEIHYYPTSQQFTAFCTIPEHLDCRKSRTAKASDRNKSQGRPLGFLVAWLKQGTSYPNKKEHVHYCSPNYSNRCEGRQHFNTLPGANSFAKYERIQREGEDPEPP